MTKPPKTSPASDDTRLRQQAIGARLRQIFDDVVNEPVPDDFLDILRRAEGSSTPANDRIPASGGGSGEQ